MHPGEKEIYATYERMQDDGSEHFDTIQDFKTTSWEKGKVKKMYCLRCKRKFESKHKGNRICPQCNTYNTQYPFRVQQV